jgi:hypothetical protein
VPISRIRGKSPLYERGEAWPWPAEDCARC